MRRVTSRTLVHEPGSPLCQCDPEQLPPAIYSLKVVSTHGSSNELFDDQQFPGFCPRHPGGSP